ncbi:hypothetical protein ABZ942_24105 [Nocardia sp. NPDC046473]|uniref:hypothetical protein n=1 Tax=Nocardia sp. NPDC046473 TaxID=3155733 RepID=UPI0033C0AB27
MTDHSTSADSYAIPEADLAEQSIPAYPNDTDYLNDGPDPDGGVDQEIAETIARDAWGADPADVIEQSITVPFDDEPEPA